MKAKNDLIEYEKNKKLEVNVLLRANENEKAFMSVLQSQSFNLFREMSLHFWKKEIDISTFDYKHIMTN